MSSDAFVFFGASGDLARRKIFPALQGLVVKGGFEGPIFGVARGPRDLDDFRRIARESLEQHGVFSPSSWERFMPRLQFVRGDYTDENTFKTLSEMTARYERPLIYLAIAPSMFGPVATGIGKLDCGRRAKLVVEKPFGRDLESAETLDRILKEYFPEEAIFRIDHYLGKEPVQNLIYFHLANQFVNAGLNRNSVEHVQITMAETLGMEGRGKFYEEVGAIRDVLQNHMLQVVACLAMECPVGTADEDLRDEKARVMKAIAPLTPEDVVRGQYEGYRNEPGVEAHSTVETFAAVRLHIENERWAQVPFYIRVGKRLPVSVTEIYIKYRPSVWADVMHEKDPGCGDYLRLRLSPTVEIAHGTRTKRAGMKLTGECIELFAKRDEVEEMLPYERLFKDALSGNHELFARSDMTLAQWRVVGNVLGDRIPVQMYPPGSWGPPASDQIIQGGFWRNPRMETKDYEPLKRTA